MSNSLATSPRLQTLTAIEIACDAGALDSGCRDGPSAFRRNSDAALRSEGVALIWQQMPQTLCAGHLPPLRAISQTARWTASITRHLIADGDAFVAIGGDHSCAIGTWSGVADALRKFKPLGLVWIDAHMDMHVPATTPSGAINGMPLACLLGYGAPDLTSIAQMGPAVAPHHICLIGVRSFEPEEVEFAERLGVRVIGMDEVRLRGINAVLAEAQAIVTDGTAGFGVSLDLDAFDPQDAPAVGTPEPGGIAAPTFLDAWSEFYRHPKCLGIEIAEYNPSFDHSGRTVQLMADIVTARTRTENAR